MSGSLRPDKIFVSYFIINDTSLSLPGALLRQCEMIRQGSQTEIDDTENIVANKRPKPFNPPYQIRLWELGEVQTEMTVNC